MLFSCYVAAYLAQHVGMPAPDKWDFRYHGDSISCRVLAVSKTAITVSCRVNDNGYKKNQVVTFPFHHRLACGSFNQLESFDRCCYARDDLLVGDRVDLDLMVLEQNIKYCITLSIRERPGGLVPPTRKYRVGDFQPHHEYVNAYAAERNDKIPIPRHLSFGARAMDYPAFDPHIPRKERFAAWPAKTPLSYIEFALFLR